MANKVSGLSYVLNMTTAPFVGGLKTATGAINGFVGKLGGASSAILKLTGVGAAIGAIAGGAGFGLLINSQLQVIDNNAKLADRLGVTTQALSGLQHAGDLAGVSAEGLTTGLEFMLKNVAKASEGGNELSQSFKDIGLDAARLINTKPEDAFLEIANALKAIDNPAKRALAATQIFGKSGQQLLPLMMSGAEGIRAVAAEADALGLSFSRVDAAKVEEANDAVSRMKSAFAGVFRTIAIAIAPALQGAADRVTGFGKTLVAGVKTWAPAFFGFAGQVYGVISSVFSRIYGFVVPIVSATVNFVTAVWPSIVAVIQTTGARIWQFISQLWNTVYGYTAGILTAIGSNIAANWQGYLASIVTVSNAILGAIGQLAAGAMDIVAGLWTGVATIWNWGTSLITGSTDQAQQSTTASFDSMGQTVQSWGEAIGQVMTVASYAIGHWRDVVEIAGINVAYYLVRTGNQIEYVITKVLPAVYDWGISNVKDFARYTGTVFSNLGSNIVSIMKNLPGLIKGTVKWGDVWKPLSDGFESTAKELAIPDRVVGDLETTLDATGTKLGDKYLGGLFDAMNAQDKRAAKTSKGIADTINTGLAAIKSPKLTVDVPTIPDIKAPSLPKMPVMKVDADTSALDDLTKKATEAKTALTAVFSNTAESQKLRYEAQFQAQQDKIVAPKVMAQHPTPTPANPMASMMNGAKSWWSSIAAPDTTFGKSLSNAKETFANLKLPTMPTVAPITVATAPAVSVASPTVSISPVAPEAPTAAEPQAQPLPQKAQASMRESADVIGLLKKLVDLASKGNQSLVDIANKAVNGNEIELAAMRF